MIVIFCVIQSLKQSVKRTNDGKVTTISGKINETTEDEKVVSNLHDVNKLQSESAKIAMKNRFIVVETRIWFETIAFINYRLQNERK